MKHSAFHTPFLLKEAARELVHMDLASLLDSATALRRAHFGNAITLCAIINAKSGNCGMDCAFCSQSSHHGADIATFPLLDVSILRQRIAQLREHPIRHCGIVTSGSALSQKEIQAVAEAVHCERINALPRLCASLGRLDNPSLAALRTAGLLRYHHNLECSETHYPKLCTTQTWRDRLETTRRARALGLEVCCGGLFGTGESWEDRLDFALALAQEGIREVPLNFLHPHPGTPLASQPVLEVDEGLRIIAIFRHILPEATLRVCGGRVSVFGSCQDMIFAAGANALMTGNYLTTTGQSIQDDLNMIVRLGLEIVA